MDADRPVQICQQQRQRFIDCMFINSRCVQGGQRTFQGCVEFEEESKTMFKECVDRLNEFKRCWMQIVVTKRSFHLGRHKDKIQGISVRQVL